MLCSLSSSKPSHLALLFLSLLVQTKPSLAQQSGFLKEILQGRCYENPPNGNESGCPTTVGSIMAILEGHKDADIEPSDFDHYVKMVDFDSPKDGAIFRLRGGRIDAPAPPLPPFLLGTKQPPPSMPIVPPVTPEETPGGSLLSKVVFCGVDQRQNCKIEESNAYWSFWKAAYGEFAARASGKVTVIVEPAADVEFFTRNAVSNFQDVTDVTVVVDKDCDSVSHLVTELQTAVAVARSPAGGEFGSVTCTTTQAEMSAVICAENDIENDSEEVLNPFSTEEIDGEDAAAAIDNEIKTPATKGEGGHGFRIFVLIMLIVATVWWCYDGEHWRANIPKEILERLSLSATTSGIGSGKIAPSSSYGTVPSATEEMNEEEPKEGRYQ